MLQMVTTNMPGAKWGLYTAFTAEHYLNP